MKNTKEYQLSMKLFSVALVLYVISIITGLIPGLVLSIAKICQYLGFSAFGLGLLFLLKSQNNDKK